MGSSVGKLRVMIPELLEANGLLPPDGDEFPYCLRVEDRAYRPAT
jgi:hypothetical protein